MSSGHPTEILAGRTEELFGRKIVAYDLGFTVLLCDN